MKRKTFSTGKKHIVCFSLSIYMPLKRQMEVTMSYNRKIGIFGGDERQVYMALSLLDKGYFVCSYRLYNPIEHKNHAAASGLEELINICPVLIGPIPLMRDYPLMRDFPARLLTGEHMLIGGAIPSSILEICNSKGVFCFDLMKSDKIAIMNAIATAEGTIMEAIKNSNINLHQSCCLVLGYGRCGKILAAKLKGLDAKVTVAARNTDALAYARAAGLSTADISTIKSILPDFHYVFNTIPSLILNQECLKAVSPDAVIIDIASAPGGVDFDYALNHGINAKLCLGLPGKVAPKASADILVDEIEAIIKERSG